MIDARKYIWIPIATFALGIAVGLFAPSCTPVKPEPPPVVVPEVEKGPRTVLIIRETEETEPNLAQAVTMLRNGEYAAYMTEHKHTLTILDDDLPEAAKIARDSGKTSVVIIDGERLLHFEPLKLDADAKAIVDQVMAALKAHGG